MYPAVWLIVSTCTVPLHLGRGGRLRKLTLLECPTQSDDFSAGCVFIGASWQEEAGTRSRITEQQWNVVQRGISWVKHMAVLAFWGGAHCGKTFIGCVYLLNRCHPAPFSCATDDATRMPAIVFHPTLFISHHNEIRRLCPMEYLSNLWLIHWKSLSKCESLNCGGVEVTVNAKC